MPRPEHKIAVLHLRSTNFYGGPERQLHRHAVAARNSDFAITVASFAEQGQPPDLLARVAADNIPTHLFDVTSAYDPRGILMIRRFLRHSRVDILCTHDYRAGILGAAAIAGTDVKWIAFSRGRTSETAAVRAFFTLERFLMRFADRVVAVSGGEKASLLRHRIPEHKIAVVHNAIDVSPFLSVKPADLRARFGFPPDAIVAVAAGRFSPEKGQTFLVRAATDAVRRQPQLRLLLFGDGPLLDSVQSEIAAAGLDDFIRCPGFEPAVAACLKGADFVVNPSLSEGLPNVVLEAMALRTPVVATAVGGVPELVFDRSTGLLVPPADPAALADAIVSLTEDPPLRNCLTENAFRLITTSFSFEKQARELVDVYRDVLGNTG